MGTAPKPKSTRARKARSVKRTPITALKGIFKTKPAGAPGHRRNRPRIPPAIEVAIDAQQDALATAISLLYCLHSALLRETGYFGKIETEAVETAADQADLTDISGMLLVQLDSIHRGLDPIAIATANPDPEMVAIAEAARKMTGQSGEVSQP